MTIADLAYGRFVTWRGLRALVVDIQHGPRLRVQIRVAGGRLHWVSPAALEAR